MRFKAVPKTPFLYNPASFYSTHDLGKIERATDKLSKAIARELKVEEENYKEDEQIKDLLKSTGFTLSDSIHNDTFELSKSIDGLTIKLYINSLPPDVSDEENEAEDEIISPLIQKNPNISEDLDKFNKVAYGEFKVYITKASGQTLEFECNAFNKEIRINFMRTIEKFEGYMFVSNFEKHFEHFSMYGGLHRDTQDSLLHYLASLGINEDMAVLVEHLAQDKHTKLYINWLKELNSLITHKQQ